MDMDKKTLLAKVVDTAREAGEYLRRERREFSLDRVEHKHAHDYVSYVDRGSEEIIVKRLKAILPEAGFVTEEGLATFDGEELYWCIDPLDGTTNFIHGLSPYAVSIALCKGEGIELGVVYDVTADEMYAAAKGEGAWLNGTPIHVSQQPFSQALLGFDLPYDAEAYMQFFLRMMQQTYGRVGSVRMSGSAALSICYVAAGRLDGWAERYIGRYDYMAAAIILLEAGGTVTNFDGSPHFTMGDDIIATNGNCHAELQEVVRVSREG